MNRLYKPIRELATKWGHTGYGYEQYRNTKKLIIKIQILMIREQNIQISSNTDIAYEPLLAAGLSEIPVYGSEAVWVQNANYPNNYTLWKQDLILGKSWIHNKTRTRIFGWTEEVAYGERKGMIEATIPSIREDENDSDCEIIGYFDSVASAMALIIERNHPDYGIWI